MRTVRFVRSLVLFVLLVSSSFLRPAPTWAQDKTCLPLIMGSAIMPGARLAVFIDPARCQWDAPGDERANLTEEYVCLCNYENRDVSLNGWQVSDAIGATYTFGDFTLPPQGCVYLRTGRGTDTATDVYWNRGNAVWNNTGDTAFLYDDQGLLVDRYSY